MKPAGAPEPGTVIDGKYRVERVLGRGGMGVVLEATHLSLGKRVAMKLLRAEGADDQARVRFAREAQIAAQLPGEHIAAVTDFGATSAGEPYLVMELLAGRDVEKELQARGPLPVDEAVDLLLQACEGVADAHAAGLVHRDLKPSNLFVVRRRDGSPLVKVLDFGLSKMTAEGRENLTATESTFGTPQYMSPEQIRSAKYVDARTDQHALAMILYELVSGRPPYAAESATGLFVVISTATAAPLASLRPGVPAGLDAAVARALAKDPDGRFPDVAAFAEAIAPFGGQGARTSLRRVTSAFGRGAAAAEPAVLAPEPPAEPPARPVTTTEVLAPRPANPPPVPAASAGESVRAEAWRVPAQSEYPTPSPFAGDPDRAPARGTKVALAVGAAAAMLLAALIVALRTGAAPAPEAPAAASPSAGTDAAAEPMASASGSAVPAATIVTAGSEAAPPVSAAPLASAPPDTPAPAKPAAPRPSKGIKKSVDQASDIFGERRK